MMLTQDQATSLKQQLGLFDPSRPLARNEIEPNSPLAVYRQQFAMAGIPANSYHLGHFQLSGPLAVWGKVTCHWWRAENSRGTVCFAPGLFDHAGLFTGLFKHLVEQGFDVLCLEMPGHGLSSGEHCAIDSFATYAAIWQAFFAQYQPLLTQPLMGVGQSTGCAALTEWVLNAGAATYFTRLVFLAPLVRPNHWRRVNLTIILLGKILKKITRASPENSHDAQFNLLLEQDVLQAKFLSASWVLALKKWIANFRELPTSSVPLLIIQGTGDQVVDWQFNLDALRAHFQAAQVRYLEGAMHHLVNETDLYRRDLFAQASQFLTLDDNSVG